MFHVVESRGSMAAKNVNMRMITDSKCMQTIAYGLVFLNWVFSRRSQSRAPIKAGGT